MQTVARLRGTKVGWSAVALVTAVGFALATVAYARWHSFGSDDVAIQNIVHSVLAGERLQPAVGNDNFLVKVPIYLLVGALMPNGTPALVVTTLLCNAPLLVALLVIGRRLLGDAPTSRRLVGGALICAYTVSQLAAVSPTMQPNGRNGEIGVALLLLWWRLGTPHARDLRSVLPAVAAVAAWTLVFFSDLFFLFVLLPAAVVSAVTMLVIGGDRRRALVPAAEIAVAAAIGWWLLTRAQDAGFVVTQNYMSGTPKAILIPGYLTATFGAIGRDFNADVWGQALGVPLVPSFVQLALTVAVTALAAFAVSRRSELRDPRIAMFAWIVIVNLALYVLTSNASDDFSFRYVFLAALLLLLLAVRGVVLLPVTRGIVVGRLVRIGAVALVSACAFGLLLNAAAIVRSRSAPDPQNRTRQIVASAAEHGARVGLGAYWDGNITTYFSQYRVRVIPQTCSAAGFTPFAWLINFPEMTAAPKPTFVVLSASSGCTAAAARTSFGAPAEQVDLDGGDQIWFYDRPLTQ